MNQTIKTDERLRERKVGNFDDELLIKRWENFSFAEEGGENLASLQKRNIEALKEILEQYKGKTIVIGTHGQALSAILNYYNKDFGIKEFQRIVKWMPYIIELKFEGNVLLNIQELGYVDKKK